LAEKYPYEIDENNYFKLRDIAESFDFRVSYDGLTNKIVIDTSKPYANQNTPSIVRL
jgi:hypothetical protein